MKEGNNKIIGACGLECSSCEAFKATKANDREALEALAVKWRVEYGSPDITAENIMCDGCLGGGRTIGYCAMCGIRTCAVGRGLENCAACPDFGCEKSSAFWEKVPQAKANLEALRKGR